MLTAEEKLLNRKYEQLNQKLAERQRAQDKASTPSGQSKAAAVQRPVNQPVLTGDAARERVLKALQERQQKKEAPQQRVLVPPSARQRLPGARKPSAAGQLRTAAPKPVQPSVPYSPTSNDVPSPGGSDDY